MKKSNLFFAVLLGLFVCSLQGFSQNSVLSSGDWYKISTDQNGIYKISYDDLVSYGIDPAAINPKNIRIYGNGNGMLPEENSEFRYDDLEENAIFVSGEDDGSFDPEDYILFYGEDATEWKLNEETMLFEHQINYYSDKTFYFLTTDLGEGKRIEIGQQASQPSNITITKFDSYFAHEEDLVNLLKGGREWYGEEIPGNESAEFNVSLNDIDISSPVNLDIKIAGQTYDTASLKIYINNVLLKEIVIPKINESSVLFARDIQDTISFYVPSDNFNIKLEYSAADTVSVWLDYFRLNYKRNLNYMSGGLAFRSVEATGSGNISEFMITNTPNDVEIWDLTDPLNVRNQDFDQTGNDLSFEKETDELLEFFAFSPQETLSPEFIAQVENQNLHALEPADVIIVSYNDFKEAAQQLADFHQENDGLSSIIVTPGKIYNEFSSGAQDVTAIRDFVKFIYDKAGLDNKPEYLLLFGSASYDYKNRIDNNTNFVPVWETKYSLNAVTAFSSDDYYGWLDDEEGTYGDVDLGIGRIPTKDITDAQAYIQKVFHYATSGASLGSWRNEVCFVADDSDNNLHIEQADSLTKMMPMAGSPFNTTKTYLDFFELIQTPEGPRYPEVNEQIDNQISEGRLLFNYTGHSYDNSWAHEQVLTKEQMESWTNLDKLPVFISASCSFAGFDNPDIETGGYLLLKNENGGAIAVFSPVKLAYANANFKFNTFLINFLNDPTQDRTLGKMQKYAKQEFAYSEIIYGWALLGDPALKIAVPQYSVSTETINGTPVTEPLDTIHPGDQITVTGFITDSYGNQLTGFNGDIFIKVFNKPYTKTTLGNNQSIPVDIIVQDSILAETTFAVTNGEYEAQFAIPENISQDFGNLKLSYYATDGVTDAAGYFSELVAGGEPNGIAELNSEKMFQVYPTYADDYISIIATLNCDNVQFTICDLTGKPIVSINNRELIKQQEIKIDVSDLANGLYILQIRTTAGISSFKIVKK